MAAFLLGQQSCDTDCNGLQSQNYFLSGHLQKKFADPAFSGTRAGAVTGGAACIPAAPSSVRQKQHLLHPVALAPRHVMHIVGAQSMLERHTAGYFAL